MNIFNQNKYYAGAISLVLFSTQIGEFTFDKSPIQMARLTEYPNNQVQDKQVSIATTIKGTISSPIIWTDNSESFETRANITLNEPLLYSDGTVALPENSSLIVEVSKWDDAGFVTLNTIEVIYQNSQGETSQRKIPEGTLLIRNEDNQLLPFKAETSNSNSIVGDFINEAAQSGARTLPGRLGSTVSRTIRNNGRRSRRSNRDAVYSVKEETEVSIYVNSFLNIE